jgi:chlorobactene glucosyltransferase
MPDTSAFSWLLTPIGLHSLFWFGVSIVLLLNAVANLWIFKKPQASIIPNDQLPFISVLVPARNEEENVEACIRSLLNQNYPRFEVIALDDNSEDSTYDILCKLRDQDYRLRVLVGSLLPEGWCGKPHACWQMANAATGEYLLFTDADCIFAPDALLFAVGGLASSNSDVVSFMPDYLAASFWEKLVIPLLVYIPIAFLPMGFVRGTRWPVFAGANGAFIFLSHDTYFDLGGHRAIRAELTEDVKFSQLVKHQGRTISYLDGKNVYKVRMYTSLSGIWNGFTRNLMPAFSNIWTCLLAMFIVLNTFILPPILAVIGYCLQKSWAILFAMTYLTTVALRLLIAIVLDRDSIVYAFLNPLSWIVAFGIACGSIWRNYKGTAEWKGRLYKGGPK